MRRDEPTVAALLARGADPNVTVKVWTPTRRSSDDYHFMPALVGASPFWLAARFTQPGIMRLLAKHGADTKVIHESNYVQGEGYQRRQEKTTAVMAALGMGGGTAWVPVDRAERDALVLETVKLAVELGADVNAATHRWPHGARFRQGAEIRNRRGVSRIERRHSRNQQEVIRAWGPCASTARSPSGCTVKPGPIAGAFLARPSPTRSNPAVRKRLPDGIPHLARAVALSLIASSGGSRARVRMRGRAR